MLAWRSSVYLRRNLPNADPLLGLSLGTAAESLDQSSRSHGKPLPLVGGEKAQAANEINRAEQRLPVDEDRTEPGQNAAAQKQPAPPWSPGKKRKANQPREDDI